ncbi:MAG: metallophosphoesterase [Armatimonadota bacterium]
MSRIVAVGDLHGETEPLFRLLDTESIDGLLCVGDWGDPGETSPDVWEALLSRCPILTVFGNHDDLPFLATLTNRSRGDRVLLEQGERRADFCGFSVAGVSGIWAKSHRLPHYVTDDDVSAFADTLASGPHCDILLTHGCPLGIADRTPSGRPGGQRCFLDLLRKVRPSVHLCGHVHIAQRRDVAEPPSLVINTGSLRDGHYTVLTRSIAGGITAEAKRLHP